MQLSEVERMDVPNGDSRVQYAFDEVVTLEDLISFVEYAERSYGEVEDIKCFRFNGSGDIECFLMYSGLADLVENRWDELPRVITFMIFSCKDRYVNFKFDARNKRIRISVSENSLGSK